MSALILFDSTARWPIPPRPGRGGQPAAHPQGPGTHALRSPASGRLARRAWPAARGGLKPGDADYEPTRLQFLEDYAAESTVHSKLFPGIVELLAGIRERGLSWGIVTNKVTYLTLPIVEFLDLTRESAVLVCGDTTAHAAAPLPLQHAAREAGFAVERCVYVGDDATSRPPMPPHATWPRPMAMWAKKTT